MQTESVLLFAQDLLVPSEDVLRLPGVRAVADLAGSPAQSVFVGATLADVDEAQLLGLCVNPVRMYEQPLPEIPWEHPRPDRIVHRHPPTRPFYGFSLERELPRWPLVLEATELASSNWLVLWGGEWKAIQRQAFAPVMVMRFLYDESRALLPA